MSKRAESHSTDVEYLLVRLRSKQSKNLIQSSRSKQKNVDERAFFEGQLSSMPMSVLVTFDWNFLLWSPFFWCSCLLFIGFLGIFITSFVSLLQVENEISKGWILWIFTIIQIALLVLLTLIYGYNRLTKYYYIFTVHSMGRLNYSIFYMWIVCIFSVSSLFSFITNPVVPDCCTNDIPGLTFPPYDVNIFVLWYINAVLICIFNFGGMMACLVGIYNVMYPEYQSMVKSTVHYLEKNGNTQPRRDDVVKFNQ